MQHYMKHVNMPVTLDQKMFLEQNILYVCYKYYHTELKTRNTFRIIDITVYHYKHDAC